LYEYNFRYNYCVLVAVRYAGRDGTARWQFHLDLRTEIVRQVGHLP